MKLQVIYKLHQIAGTLWRDQAGFHFEYTNEFISDLHSYPISINMPKTKKKYSSPKLFSNFQSMLCEGYNRELQCKALGIDLSDDWNLLLQTCEQDTIGAITLKKIDE